MLFLLVGVLMTSCSGFKKLSPEQCLLIANKVKVQKVDGKRVDDKRINASGLNAQLVQDPNKRFLGMRLKLGVYNLSKDSVNNWWNLKLRELGEPPVVFDSTAIDQSILRYKRYLANKGYFEPDVYAQIKRVGKKKRKIKVYYKINLNQAYVVREIKAQIKDDSIAANLENWSKETLLHPGMYYDVDLFDSERDRISKQLRNRGYFAFNKEYISYQVDSAFNHHEMHVTMTLRQITSNQLDSTGSPLYLPHKKYYLDKIYFEPHARDQMAGKVVAYDTIVYRESLGRGKKKYESPPYYMLVSTQRKKPIIRPAAVVQKTFMTEGDIFRMDNVDQSYGNLNDFRIFSFADISVTEKPYDTNKSYEENNKLDCKFSLVQGKKFGFTTEAEVTTSSGSIPGVGANLTFQDKNLFRGGEILSVRLRGMFELQASLDNQKNRTFLNTFEIKGEVNIEFPRFLAPISIERLSKYFHPKSIVSLSYSYQNKVDYSRGIFMATWGYTWRKGKVGHLFNPIEINTVKMLNMTQQFLSDVEALSKNNLRLKYQYEDHLILDWKYVMTYTDQKAGVSRDFNYLRFGVETAGNLLYGITAAVNARKNASGQYQIFDLAFSQYARMELDYKHHFVFGKKTDLVFRTKFGLGYSYANSKSLPYEKSFFTGGSNNLRAWPLYQVGPGSYSNPENAKMERLGDMVWMLNLEQRFPIIAGLRGAVFIDAGNIWLLTKNDDFEGGEFRFDKFYKDFAVGTGFGLRYDFGFFLIRLDLGIPLRDPGKPEGKRWVVKNLLGRDLMFNFGIGYPF